MYSYSSLHSNFFSPSLIFYIPIHIFLLTIFIYLISLANNLSKNFFIYYPFFQSGGKDKPVHFPAKYFLKKIINNPANADGTRVSEEEIFSQPIFHNKKPQFQLHNYFIKTNFILHQNNSQDIQHASKTNHVPAQKNQPSNNRALQ